MLCDAPLLQVRDFLVRGPIGQTRLTGPDQSVASRRRAYVHVHGVHLSLSSFDNLSKHITPLSASLDLALALLFFDP
jgi:hypothetical protein